MQRRTEEATLVQEALTGSMGAYAMLTRRWSARVMAVCHARVGSVDAAEDLAQETLLRGLKALPSLREPGRFGPWICGIAHRTCLDWIKRRKRREVTAVDLDTLGRDEPRSAGVGTELMAAIEQLPESCREVVLLYYYHDFTYQQLAELLAVSPATINARLTKARGLLRSRLAEKK